MASINTSKIVLVTVYWDRSDWENQSWAYRAIDGKGVESSGPLSSNELHEAIDEACSELHMTGIEQDFALSIEEGGYAVWSQIGE